MAAYCIAAQSIWPEIEVGKRILEDMGKIEIPACDCVPRDSELVKIHGRLVRSAVLIGMIG